MSEAVRRNWTLDEFFAWQERQEARYELVGGFPLRMMTGASNVHDMIVINILGELRNQLRGSRCRPFSADGSVETFPRQIRRPDAGVDCGNWEQEGFRAAEPTILIEVLSPSTRDFDTFGKLDEYKSIMSVKHVLFVEPNTPLVVLWSRKADETWAVETIEGIERVVGFASPRISLPLSEVYEGVKLSEPKPVREL